MALPGTYHALAGPIFTDYFWIPIVGPLIGGVIGVLLYDLFIGDVLHARLKMTEDVEGPIPESQLAEAPGRRAGRQVPGDPAAGCSRRPARRRDARTRRRTQSQRT